MIDDNFESFEKQARHAQYKRESSVEQIKNLRLPKINMSVEQIKIVSNYQVEEDSTTEIAAIKSPVQIRSLKV